MNRTQRWTIAVFAAVFVPNLAQAAGAAGGGALPWDQPLTVLRNDLTGPVSFILSLVAFFVCGAQLVFGGEMNEFARRMMYAIMIAAFLVGVQNTAAALGIAGALV